MNNEINSQKHTINPVYNKDSKILILGTFPSVKSREQQFFYGHPQNRFWKVLATVLNCDIPSSIDEKKSMLLKHNIAIWDVIAKCDIKGSSDSSIKNVVPSDITSLLKKTNIKFIYVNGSKAKQLYDKYLLNNTKIEATLLPSTSPANATWTLEKLIDAWSIIKH